MDGWWAVVWVELSWAASWLGEGRRKKESRDRRLLGNRKLQAFVGGKAQCCSKEETGQGLQQRIGFEVSVSYLHSSMVDDT